MKKPSCTHRTSHKCIIIFLLLAFSQNEKRKRTGDSFSRRKTKQNLFFDPACLILSASKICSEADFRGGLVKKGDYYTYCLRIFMFMSITIVPSSSKDVRLTRCTFPISNFGLAAPFEFGPELLRGALLMYTIITDLIVFPISRSIVVFMVVIHRCFYHLRSCYLFLGRAR